MGTRILLVGCGKMGGAMLGGWLAGDIDAGDVVVIEPFAGDDVRARFGVTVLTDIADRDPGFLPDIVVFAVKPQSMDEVLPAYREFVRPETAFLSIAAGRTLASFRKYLGEDAAIVRTMPNTPAAIGRGITVACASAPVTDAQRALAQSLLEAVGAVDWVEDEELLDAVTAVSGSGPAYVFLLIEAMTDAGIAAGLAPDLAEKLARATVAGSGELARQSDEQAAVLRRNVTSPGGTTAAALDVLMADDGLSALMRRAVEAAAKRSRELAG